MPDPSSPTSDAALGALRSPSSRSFDGLPLRRLLALMRAETSDLWIVIIYSAGVGLLSLVVPVAVQSLVNTVAFGSLLQPLVVLTLFVLVALGFSAVMNAFRVYVVELIQRRLFVRVSTDVTQRLLRVKLAAFDRMHGPELVNRFFDVVTVQKSAALLLIEGSSLVMQTIVGMILLAVYHPLLLAFDLILIISMVVIIFVLGRGAIPTAIKESKSKYQMAAWLEELASHLSTFRSTSAARYALERADELAMLYVERRRTHFKIVLRQIVGSLLLQAVASAVLPRRRRLPRDPTAADVGAARRRRTHRGGGRRRVLKIWQEVRDVLRSLRRHRQARSARRFAGSSERAGSPGCTRTHRHTSNCAAWTSGTAPLSRYSRESRVLSSPANASRCSEPRGRAEAPFLIC